MATKRLAQHAGPAPFLDLLHEAQARDGYLSPDALQELAGRLETPLADLYSAASLYHYVRTRPDAAIPVGVCHGPVCRLLAGDQAEHELRRRLAIGPDGRSADGRYRYQGVPCPGLCDCAPAVFLDGRFYASGDGAPVWPPQDGPTPLARSVPGDTVVTSLIGSGRAFTLLREALGSLGPEEVISAVSESGLLGRGGAAFPAGRKWTAVRSASGGPKYVVCNADEGEPGTFKDRLVLEHGPDLLIAGMALAGYAVGAEVGIIYLRYEYPRALDALRSAIERAEAEGVLGGDAGSGFSFRVYMRRGAGAYVCGEETSLLNSLEGKRPWPRDRPPYPTTHGLFGRPTLVNNVETLAAVPAIVRRGAEWFRGLGRGDAAGAKLYSLSGRVRRPGNYELPLGTTARELIFEHGRGIADGRSLTAFTLGGVSGGLLPAAALDLPLDYESPPGEGALLGSGGVIVLDERDCVVRFALECMRFFEAESCGKCYPCRIGTVRLRELLERATGLAERSAPRDDAVRQYREVAEAMRIGSACGLGPSAGLLVGSLFRHFRAEVEDHVLRGRCATGVCGRRDG